jgi:hypothetical protein
VILAFNKELASRALCKNSLVNSKNISVRRLEVREREREVKKS